LEQYLIKHPKVSEEFIAAVKADIKFRYLSKLMFIYKKNASRGQTVKEILLDKKYQNNEVIFDVNNYFDSISVKELNKPELLNNSSFKTFFSSYIRDYLVDPNLENYSSEKFLAEKEFLLANFKGKLQYFGIVRLINDYNNFAQTENVYNLKTLIQEYKKNLTEPSYLKKIEEIESELALVNNLFSKEALNAKLLSLKGDTLLFKDVLKLTNSNIKAIDFWASWCAPCINEVMKGYDIRKKISKENNIEWLYFSIDENKEDWIKRSMELDKYGLTKNQYLILDHKNSGLSNFLNVYQIPRYVILDKNDLIRNGNAPRPSFENQFEKIINEINYSLARNRHTP
jgi:thiol-disulfide isomerase/thioredoxin